MTPEQLRAAIAYLDTCLRELHQDADGELRTLSTEEQVRFDEGLAMRQDYARQLERHATIAELHDVGAGEDGDGTRDAPHVIRKADPFAVMEDRSATAGQLADAVTRSLESRVDSAENMTHVRSVIRRHLADDAADSNDEIRAWARNLIGRTHPNYVRAWAKMATGREALLTNEERAALQIGSNTAGGYLVPTHLDPTLILTNAGSSNAIRGISRVVTLPGGFNTWNGVTSAGVTASWDGELVEVSDDSPTVGRVAIATNVAQAFVQASIAAFDDIAGLASDILMLFGDARDRLEGTAHATGLGSSNQPKGVFTAVHAVSGSRVVSTTAATIGEVDIHGVYRTVPVRWRNRSSWVANPLYTLAVKRLGTAVSSAFSGDLTMPVTDRILGRPVVESDDAPTTQTTTALDDEILFGDFSQYIIVDKPGSMSVEFIPHLFNTANNLPDGRRGWYAYWRTGADVSTASAFAVLVDKTSA